MRRRTAVLLLRLAVCLLLGLLAAPGAALAEAGLGVVLLHGKHGSPDRYISGLASALRAAGYAVATPELPWSKARGYNKGYMEALAEIDSAVRELRARGAGRVVLAGHSLGANAALGYAARHRNLAGLICLAPGHAPETGRLRDGAAEAVARAKSLMASGEPDGMVRFADLNMGRSFETVLPAAVFLSYFDPDGPAVMPVNAAHIHPPLPLLWVVGERDPLSRSGRAYAFDRAPAHPLSRYASVDAEHLGVPDAARDLVLDWLKGLPR